MDDSCIEFLAISRCRMREHYRLKLRSCLVVLTQEQLRQSLTGESGKTIGGLLWHILEHIRRHTEWMRAHAKPQYAAGIEEFFPTTDESPGQLCVVTDDVFQDWETALTCMAAEVRSSGCWPSGTPEMGAIYHLVEHISYHLGQIIWETERLAGTRFAFCQHGIDEKTLTRVVECELERIMQ